MPYYRDWPLVDLPTSRSVLPPCSSPSPSSCSSFMHHPLQPTHSISHSRDEPQQQKRSWRRSWLPRRTSVSSTVTRNQAGDEQRATSPSPTNGSASCSALSSVISDRVYTGSRCVVLRHSDHRHTVSTSLGCQHDD